MTTYISNFFESTQELDYSRFRCYKARLKVSESQAWETLRTSKVKLPYFVTAEHVFFTDQDLASQDFFVSMVTGKPQEATLSNEKTADARTIGSMLYRSFNSYLTKLKFNCVGGITANSTYYLPEDTMYVKKIVRDEGTYSVIRGIGPKIYAKIKPGSVFVFFEIRHDFRIEIPLESWVKWTGYGVKIRGPSSFRGMAILDKVNGKNGVGILKYGKKTFEAPLNEMYIPGSPAILGKRRVFEAMLEFANFMEETQTIQDSFSFLNRVFQIILQGDCFTLKMDKEGSILCAFRRVCFQGGKR